MSTAVSMELDTPREVKEEQTPTQNLSLDDDDAQGGAPSLVYLCTARGEKVPASRSQCRKFSVFFEGVLDDPKCDTIKVHESIPKRMLELIVEWMEYHDKVPSLKVEKPIRTSDIKVLLGEWDAAFCQKLSQEDTFELMVISNHFRMPDLLTLCFVAAAAPCKDKTPAELQQMFNISGDYTDEEEREIEKKWGHIFRKPVMGLKKQAPAVQQSVGNNNNNLEEKKE